MLRVCTVAQFAYIVITGLRNMVKKLSEVWERNVLEVCSAAQLVYNVVM